MGGWGGEIISCMALVLRARHTRIISIAGTEHVRFSPTRPDVDCLHHQSAVSCPASRMKGELQSYLLGPGGEGGGRTCRAHVSDLIVQPPQHTEVENNKARVSYAALVS